MKKIFATFIVIFAGSSVLYCTAQVHQTHFTHSAKTEARAPRNTGANVKAEPKMHSALIAPAKPDSQATTAHKAELKKDSTLCFPLKRDNAYSLYTYVIDLRDKRVI